MIHVFYVPGMFGATIEYVLRDFTNELEPTNALLGSDGSMHSFKRQNLPKNKSMLDNIKMGEISTPPYPFGDLHLPEMLELYPINVGLFSLSGGFVYYFAGVFVLAVKGRI